MELIHHYTDIQSLACILKNRTLRFTRLDKLDDAQEVELVSRKHWSQYLFVSSWSTLTDESQAMWLLIGTAMDPFRWRRNRSTPFAP